MKTIFDGIKMIGYQDEFGQWWKVKVDCVQCGECCLDKGIAWPFADDEGRCTHLKKHESGKFLCGLRSERPFSCCVNTLQDDPYCKVELEKIDDPSTLL